VLLSCRELKIDVCDLIGHMSSRTYLDGAARHVLMAPYRDISSHILTYLDGAARPCKIDGVVTMCGVMQAWCDFSIGASCSTVAKSQVCSSAAPFVVPVALA